MKKYMVVHRAPGLSWETVQKNWRKLAQNAAATWIRTYFNVDEGVRYCVWDSPDSATLIKIFTDLEISFESVTEVEETTPDMWGREEWEEHLVAESTADTLGI
jgi:hypothetical protein